MIRLDKIGDLVATLPVDQLSGLTDKTVDWVVAKGLGWIAENSIPKRTALELSLYKKDWRKSHQQLCEFLLAKKPEAVIVFYAPWWVSWACWQVGVPLRVGRRSQWHSFLFFNRGLRQSRSEARQHEADYNRELVEFALNLPAQPTPFLQLAVPENSPLLQKLNITSQAYYVVHPGMFGSALNWPQSHYNQLIELLISRAPVVITGTDNDARFLQELAPRWQEHSQVRWTVGQLRMPELLAVLGHAKATVAPSTGVLHLSAALGTPSFGIYSPVQVHHPRRWGPRGQNTKYFLPPVDCPANLACLEDKCSEHPCMGKINPMSIFQELP